jgi:hypothetical protein
MYNTLPPLYNMYDQYDFDNILDPMLNNRLFCTFSTLENLDTLISGLVKKYDIMYNKMFVLHN